MCNTNKVGKAHVCSKHSLLMFRTMYCYIAKKCIYVRYADRNEYLTENAQIYSINTNVDVI